MWFIIQEHRSPDEMLYEKSWACQPCRETDLSTLVISEHRGGVDDQTEGGRTFVPTFKCQEVVSLTEEPGRSRVVWFLGFFGFCFLTARQLKTKKTENLNSRIMVHVCCKLVTCRIYNSFLIPVFFLGSKISVVPPTPPPLSENQCSGSPGRVMCLHVCPWVGMGDLGQQPWSTGV
jgi:hypothetical protein